MDIFRALWALESFQGVLDGQMIAEMVHKLIIKQFRMMLQIQLRAQGMSHTVEWWSGECATDKHGWIII